MTDRTATEIESRAGHPNVPAEFEHWQTATHQANEAFCAGDYSAAQEYFFKSTQYADQLLFKSANGYCCPRIAVNAFLRSRHNMGEILLRCNRIEDAGRVYLFAYQRICTWMLSRNTPRSFRDMCHLMFAPAYEAVIAHLEKTGADPERISDIHRHASLALADHAIHNTAETGDKINQ